MRAELVDRTAILQVIGGLMRNPHFLAEIDRYNLTVDDFYDRFYKLIYATIYNLYNSGVTNITPFEVDSSLAMFPSQYEIFTKNDGVNYLEIAYENSSVENFDYYYNRVKKFSALRTLHDSGFDIKKIYNVDILDGAAATKVNAKFDSLTLEDMFDIIQGNILTIQEKYLGSASSTSCTSDVNARSLKEELKRTPEYGMPLQGDLMNVAARGARLAKLYLRSAPTGVGKSRTAVGDACHLAFTRYYDTHKREWVKKGAGQKVLFITTEMPTDEIQTMQWAYLSGVNEETILNGTYRGDEEQRVDQAITIIEEEKDNFIIDWIPDYSRTQIINAIRRHAIVNNVKYVFFDYIFSSPGLLNEFKDLDLREDVILGMMSASLKDVAGELGLCIFTATQVNGNWEDKKGIKNQNLLRGSKAIADKIDFGFISTPVTKEQSDLIQPILRSLNCTVQPNMTFDIYKARRSRYKNVRIWSYVDLGTCRVTDLFATDEFYKIIPMDTIEYAFEVDDEVKPEQGEKVEIEVAPPPLISIEEFTEPARVGGEDPLSWLDRVI